MGNRIEDKLNGDNLNTYQYDANNLLTHSEKLTTNENVWFRYGVDNQRYMREEDSTDQDGNPTIEATFYAGSSFELIRNDGTDETEIKFHATDYLTVTRKNNQLLKRHFLQKDRLGSTTQILDENGAVIHTKGYDAFGKPRDGDTWARMEPAEPPALNFEEPNASSLTTDITKRGFTGHEHLDNFELIHMNGRMYDFNNGRFLSVDPFIQGTTSQAINPYSYIQNNPLSGVDPTGYMSEGGAYGCNTTHGGGCAQDGNIFAQAQRVRNKAASFNGRARSKGRNTESAQQRASANPDIADIESQEEVAYKHSPDWGSKLFSFVQFSGSSSPNDHCVEMLNCGREDTFTYGGNIGPATDAMGRIGDGVAELVDIRTYLLGTGTVLVGAKALEKLFKAYKNLKAANTEKLVLKIVGNKHKAGGFGSHMDLPDEVQEALLQTTILSGKTRWGYLDGKPYVFQNSSNTWHGYGAFDRTTGWNMEIPQNVLNTWKKEGVISKPEYKKLVKQNIHVTD